MIVREAQGRGDLLVQKAQARLEEMERDITELRLGAAASKARSNRRSSRSTTRSNSSGNRISRTRRSSSTGPARADGSLASARGGRRGASWPTTAAS